MITRTFKAPNLRLALEEVQRELGPEALVISAREIPNGHPWQVWLEKAVEVVAMQGDPTSLVSQYQIQPVFDEDQEGPGTNGRQKDHPQNMGVTLEASVWGGGCDLASLSRPLVEAYRDLIHQGVEQSLVEHVILTCSRSLSPLALESGSRVREHLQNQLEAGLTVRSQAALDGDKITFLVGMRGAGKTSVAARLATYYQKEGAEQVVWICADTFRAGAIPEARIYSETIGSEMHIVYSPEELEKVIEDHHDADRILVDTLGCNPYRERDVVSLGAYLTVVPKRTTHMVASARTKTDDLYQALSAFNPFQPEGLILTMLDETQRYGSVFNLAWRSEIPLAYFSLSPSVLDGLKPANPNRLVRALFGESFVR